MTVRACLDRAAAFVIDAAEAAAAAMSATSAAGIGAGSLAGGAGWVTAV
jgi:hypothetical protein